MKRPQFGLRSMLLVVALFATIFAWRNAVGRKQFAENNTAIANLQAMILAEQRWRSNCPQEVRLNFPPGKDPITAADQRISKMQAELDKLTR
jgi:hypothetical protein